MPPFYVISIKQFMVLLGCSYTTARREYAKLRVALGVRKVQAHQLAAYWSVDLDSLAAALK
jgi:hypothetical protein